MIMIKSSGCLLFGKIGNIKGILNVSRDKIYYFFFR